MTVRTGLALLGGVLLLAGCAGGKASYRPGGDLPYPPKAEPKPGDIHHVPTGLPMSFEGMMDILSGARLVCVGETHDNINDKRVAVAILEELERRYPGKVAVGMEMFRVPQQEALDRWTRGELTEREFLREAKWRETWGYDFGYYRDILRFAKESRIDVIALNPSKEIQSEVSATGLDRLTPDLKAKLPEIDDTDPFERAVAKSIYGGHLPTEGMFDSFFRVQLLWEESMAQRVADYLKSPRGEGKKVLTLTGGWHVKYGFGLPKKVARRIPVSYAIVLPEAVSIPEEKKEEMMDVDLPQVPLLPADFVWWVKYEDLEKDRVRMGVHLSEKDGKVIVEAVSPGSPAEKAGILPGDRIVTLDGQPVAEAADVQDIVEAKREGNKAVVMIGRNGAERPVELTFFKMPKGKAHK